VSSSYPSVSLHLAKRELTVTRIFTKEGDVGRLKPFRGLHVLYKPNCTDRGDE